MSGTEVRANRFVAAKGLGKALWELIFLALMFYFVIGFFSIVGVAMGQDVRYMPFWHAPWKWLFSLLG